MPTLYPATSSNGLDTLLRLLDADSVPQGNHSSSQHRQARSFSPKFDVRESGSGYELAGELAGIQQDDIEIEFVDANTLVIKGHTVRDYGHVKSSDVEKAHKATVEDDEEEQQQQQVAKKTQGGDVTETKRHEEVQYKYWVRERPVGEFQRTFSFPGKVDRDGVKASLKEGVLKVFVPKEVRKEAESKKIKIG